MRVRGMALGTGAAAIVACGGYVSDEASSDTGDASAFPATDFQSGTRLRAQTYRTSDGQSIFHDWFDSELGVRCAFARAEDGILRCLPDYAGYEVMYADASCNEPAVLLDRNDPDPAGPRYATAASCAGGRAFLGGEGAVALAPAYTLVNGSCTPTVDDFGTFVIAQHVDASAFVAGKWITKHVDGTLGARVIVADDGARATMSAYDFLHGDDCDLGDPTINPGAICAPLTASDSYPLCNDAPIAVACANALPSALRTQDGCVVGAATAVPLAQSCFAGEQTTVASGEPFEPPHLAQADEGTGRLRVRWVTSAGGEPIRVAGFYDSVLDMPCRGGIYGGRRCLPEASTILEYPRVIGGCYAPDPEPAIVGAGCSEQRFAFLKGQYYVRGAPLEVGAKLCAEGETCACSTYDGSGGAYHSTPVAYDAFEALDDVTE